MPASGVHRPTVTDEFSLIVPNGPHAHTQLQPARAGQPIADITFTHPRTHRLDP